MMIIPFCGKVSSGTGKARDTSFPTANIPLTNSLLSDGTYKINAVIGNLTTPGMGVFFKDRGVFEAHLFGFQGDLYEREITIYPLLKIRENLVFDTKQQAIQQFQKDKETCLGRQLRVLTFGTFDHFHQGHDYYLSVARRYGDSLITIIARDETVEKVKGLTPTHTETERLKRVKSTGISTHVLLGSTTDHYSCFEERNPDVICLGYDQHSFDEGIIEWYISRELELPQIVRIDSHHPDTYKSSFYRQ